MYDRNGNYKNYTMMQILWNFAGTDSNANQDQKDWYELGAHTVAAYLNSWASIAGSNEFVGGAVYGLSPDQVVNLYNAYHASQPENLKVLLCSVKK